MVTAIAAVECGVAAEGSSGAVVGAAREPNSLFGACDARPPCAAAAAQARDAHRPEQERGGGGGDFEAHRGDFKAHPVEVCSEVHSKGDRRWWRRERRRRQRRWRW